MTKDEKLDCVDVKRRAQRALLKEIRGDSLRDELAALHRLAEESGLWKKLRNAKRRTAARSRKGPAKQRKTG